MRPSPSIRLSPLFLLCLCACQQKPHVETAKEIAARGNPDGPPTLAALPTMPIEPKNMGERTHGAFTMANQLLEIKCPAAPADRSYKALSEWVEAEVAPWVQKRRDGVDDTRFLFAQPTPQLPQDVVVSAAVVALLQEDTALALQNIPQPSELDGEPDIAAMYRDVIRAQATPLLGSALVAYRDCANAGYQEAGDLARWAKFCHARYDRLRAENKDIDSPH